MAFWRGIILPELGEQLGTSRNVGSSRFRSDIPPIEPPPSNHDAENRYRKNRKIAPSQAECSLSPQKLILYQVSKMSSPAPRRSDKTPSAYPQGERLRSTEFEASKMHAPAGAKSGKPPCRYYNSNAVRPEGGQGRQIGLRKQMKQTGSHWAIKVQLARRGGFRVPKVSRRAQSAAIYNRYGIWIAIRNLLNRTTTALVVTVAIRYVYQMAANGNIRPV